MALLKDIEKAEPGQRWPLADILDALPYNDQGLIAAIAQDHHSKDVLMLAWMDRVAIERTLSEGLVCYYSRSRQTHWRKGESSGHLQHLVHMSFDCDGDAILVTVKQDGPACHTNRPTCFYLRVTEQEVVMSSSPSN
jgi:phosphoribosyl-AMP cyclohydrolase